MECEIEKGNNRTLRINGERIQRKADLLNVFHCVLFIPDDLGLVKDGPSRRRDYLDSFMESLDPSYGNLSRLYQRILFQRNHLLRKNQKNRYFREQMKAMNHQILESGTRIMVKRRKMVEMMSTYAFAVHGRLSYNKENLRLYYDSTVKATKEEEIKREYLQQLRDAFPEDLEKGNTRIGPHRDDLGIELNGLDARTYASKATAYRVLSQTNGSPIEKFQTCLYCF